MAFDLRDAIGEYRTAQQKRNAEQLAQADAPTNEGRTLRGQQNTAPLGMPKPGSNEAIAQNFGRLRRGMYDFFAANDGDPTTNPGDLKQAPRSRGTANLPADYKATEQAAGKAATEFRPGAGFTPMVTPAEQARQSEVQRMAQQYGGNEMRLALMDKAPTDQRLVDYYGAQARGAQSLSDQMGEYFANTERFGGDRGLADQFIQQHAGVAFREFTKANPQAVVGEGQKAAFSSIEPEAIQDTMDQGGLSREDAIRQIQQGTAALMGEPQGTDRLQSNEAEMDGTIDLEGGMRNREQNQANAFGPLREAGVNQAIKTDEGVGVQGMQPKSVAIAAENLGQLSASPFFTANKEEMSRLGINAAVDPSLLDSVATRRVLKQLASIKGNIGFSYDA